MKVSHRYNNYIFWLFIQHYIGGSDVSLSYSRVPAVGLTTVSFLSRMQPQTPGTTDSRPSLMKMLDTSGLISDPATVLSSIGYGKDIPQHRLYSACLSLHNLSHLPWDSARVAENVMAYAYAQKRIAQWWEDIDSIRIEVARKRRSMQHPLQECQPLKPVWISVTVSITQRQCANSLSKQPLIYHLPNLVSTSNSP